MLDRAAGMGDLIRAHRGIADERELVVVAEFVEQLRGRRTLGEAALVVLPHALVRAVVEIEEFEALELARRGRADRKSDVWGTSVSVRVSLGGRRVLQKK